MTSQLFTSPPTPFIAWSPSHARYLKTPAVSRIYAQAYSRLLMLPSFHLTYKQISHALTPLGHSRIAWHPKLHKHVSPIYITYRPKQHGSFKVHKQAASTNGGPSDNKCPAWKSLLMSLTALGLGNKLLGCRKGNQSCKNSIIKRIVCRLIPK